MVAELDRKQNENTNELSVMQVQFCEAVSCSLSSHPPLYYPYTKTPLTKVKKGASPSFWFSVFLWGFFLGGGGAALAAYGHSQARDRIGVAVPVKSTAIATQDLSQVCNLPHSSWQHWILDPLSEARDRTRSLMVPSQIRFHFASTGTPRIKFSLLRSVTMPRLYLFQNKISAQHTSSMLL